MTTRGWISSFVAVMVLVCGCTVMIVRNASSAPNAGPGEANPVFAPCSICHAIGASAAVSVGPPLNGIVGRRWATYPTFAYSPGLVAGREAGRLWDETTLDAWLAKPSSVVPGTKMIFPGLADPKSRQAVIGYLRRFSEAGQAQ